MICAETAIDVSGWIRVHPGGAALLRDAIGTDVTAKLFGDAPAYAGGRQHAHSAAALRLLHE